MSSRVARRRILAAAAAAVMVYLPTVGLSQPKRRMYRVGVLGMNTPGKEFVAELARRGYVEGVNIVFEYARPVVPPSEWGAVLPSEWERLAGQLVKTSVDVIYTHGGSAAVGAKNATSSIPIVFVASPDPVGMGLVRNLAHPGANLTGSSLQGWETNGKEIQLFAEACGKLTHLAVLYQGATLGQEATASAVNAAKALGIRIEHIKYASVRELEPLVERLARDGVDGIALADPLSGEAYRRLAALLIKLRVPSIGDASQGFLLGYDYSSTASARVAAKQVDEILKGAKPGDLPVEQDSTFELAINLRTAKALGLSVPSSVLLQATMLIE